LISACDKRGFAAGEHAAAVAAGAGPKPPLRNSPAYLGKKSGLLNGIAPLWRTVERETGACRHADKSALTLSRERAMIDAGCRMAGWWLSIGTPIWHEGQYAPRDRVSRKPRTLRCSLITVSDIIEPPHCLHSIDRFPSVRRTQANPAYAIERTHQEHTGLATNEKAECGNGVTLWQVGTADEGRRGSASSPQPLNVASTKVGPWAPVDSVLAKSMPAASRVTVLHS
jgi:hypothetical protein